MLTNPRLLKLNFGILCVHTLLMSSFVALPPLLERAGLPRDSQWQAYLVTMLIAFVSVVPFIIYAEKRRKMKRVFQICVLVLLIAELVLWQSGLQLWGLLAGLQIFFIGFNVMEALLPSLISKESPPATRAPPWGSTPPASSSGWPSVAASAACSTAWAAAPWCLAAAPRWPWSGSG